eukprot:CAMPEP_0181292202 /NCGR_PEP_ID=MMETSP1101-20121128/2378_1 /TAXON_ID=46948 /ORGANISM="Rhodomonas abbreviata, Strain Caron Lab Isolate" /LENGTH=775 /DNA_ID=CAMNT_0023396651 /DNA_START=258 /DNA_END=2582 /DNA_ORIENTATION=-
MMAARRKLQKKRIAAALESEENFNSMDSGETGAPIDLASRTPTGTVLETAIKDPPRDAKEEKKEVRKWFWGFAKYVIFISVFTTVNVGFRPSLELFEFAQMWKDLIASSLPDFMFIENVWPFLYGPVLNILSPDFYLQTNQYWNGDHNQYIYGNRLLGSVRMRQVRVSNSRCSVLQNEFLVQDPSIQQTCFPGYKKSEDEGRNGGPGFQRAKDLAPIVDLPCEEQGCRNSSANSTVCCADQPWFKYRDYQELGESSVDFWATFHRYPGGGYVADLTDPTQGLELLETLQNHHGWLDLKTRALFVDFTFYNPNVDLFVVSRIVFEFLPSGLVKPFTSFRVLKLISYSFDDPSTWPRIVCESVLALFIGIYSFDEWRQLTKSLRLYRWKFWPAMKSHFGDMWNTLDAVILTGLFVVTWLKVENTTKVAEILQDVGGIDPSALQTLGFWATQEANVSGVLALILWIKVFRYIRITTRLERLFHAIWKAVPDLVTYGLIFGLWIFAFSVSGIIIFGNDVDMFVDLNWSMTYCMRIIFGDFDYETLFWANRILGPIWIFAFMWSAVIILLNFFVAILCEVYAEVMDEAENDTKRSLFTIMADHAKVLLRMNEQLDVLKNAEAQFEQIDEDGDGKVTKVELALFLEREGVKELFDSTEVSEVIKRFDKNDNGYLDMEEMRELKTVLQKRREELEGRIEQTKNQVEEFPSANPRVGGGAAILQGELRVLREQIDLMQEKAEKSAQLEKKMLQALEGLTAKVDSLMQRDQDFKFLRGATAQDW